MVLDYLAERQTAHFHIGKWAHWATFQYCGSILYLIKPTTYMNHSGRATAYWCNKLKLPIEQMLIVVDDLALPLGKLRMRARGTHAGHNGLKSIETSLNSQAYPRLRVGIGNDFPKGKKADYVLAPFTGQELVALSSPLKQACQMIDTFCKVGIAHTMSQYN